MTSSPEFGGGGTRRAADRELIHGRDVSGNGLVSCSGHWVCGESTRGWPALNSAMVDGIVEMLGWNGQYVCDMRPSVPRLANSWSALQD